MFYINLKFFKKQPVSRSVLCERSINMVGCIMAKGGNLILFVSQILLEFLFGTKGASKLLSTFNWLLS